VRLATCIAIEALVGAAVLTGVGVGARYGIVAAQAYVAGRHQAGPSVADPAPVAAPAVVPAAVAPIVDAAPPAADAAVDARPGPDAATAAWPTITTVFPADDATLLAGLADAAVTRVTLNRGGTSLSLRLDLVGGARAAFKPQQIHWQSNPRKELAAYRLDRLLGIGRVAPVLGRSFAIDDLVAALDPSIRGLGKQRLAVEALARGGRLAGAVSWWIPEIRGAMLRGFRIDSTDGVVTWRKLLRAGSQVAERERVLLASISTMTAFDFLIDNIDRWTGGNAKVAPGSDELFFMDNTMSFTSDGNGHRKSQLYLERVQMFSRRLVGAVRALTPDALARAMAADLGPFDEILSGDEQRALLGRRDALLVYVDQLIASHGEAAVLGFD
jgi:hypothetical protein